MLELAIKGGKKNYGWLTFLLIIIGVGFLLYLRQLDFGLGITGMSRDVTWGFYIAQFTFLVGVAFTLPLFILSMSRDFGLLGSWSHAVWVNWLFWALATPVQFYTGWDYYVGGLKSLKNKSANMDVLVAMGSSVAYVYSMAVLLFPTVGVHVYFETSAVIITLIKMGKLLEARTTPPSGGGLHRWQSLADTLSDCSTLLVSGIGGNPQKVLSAAGIEVLKIEGLIDEAVRAVFAGEPLNHMVKRSLTKCGEACSGSGMGCG